MNTKHPVDAAPSNILDFNIQPVADPALSSTLQKRLDTRTKPLNSLGKLENLAHQVGMILGSDSPCIQQPHIVVFAGDHGAAAAGVSAYPQAVTVQMVNNFMAGGAAINVLARQNGLNLSIVDSGVAADIPKPDPSSETDFIAAKIAYGTANYLETAAMTEEQCLAAMARGASLIKALSARGCNAIGFGEMGIGNTSSASLITHLLCQAPLVQVIGRGTGHDDEGLARKLILLQRANQRVVGRKLSALQTLTEFGGFEIAMMTGAYLAAAQERMLIVVDGFIATSALLVAHALHPAVRDYCVFSHCSAEPGHRLQLEYLRAESLLALNLCLGEGSGSALAFPLIRNALALMNDMAGFADAGVSTKSVQ